MAGSAHSPFLDSLRGIDLLSPTELEELESLRRRIPDTQVLARELVRRGLLTGYQLDQLGRGRTAHLLLGPYRILEPIGEGATGQVFKARHGTLARLVALKVLHEDQVANPRTVQRFLREARAAAHLRHPNIVLAHDAGEAGGRHYLAMEYVDGVDLARLVKQSGPLAIPQACEYVRQAALGLQHAHERGLVHRDIKPGNLLVTRSASGAPLVKILDFGLARFESERDQQGRLTQVGNL